MLTRRKGPAHDYGVPVSDEVNRSPAAEHAEVLPGMMSRDPQVLEIADLVSLVADTSATVLIAGETGTGKELIAQAIYQKSSRRQRPLITMNCGAVPETLQESELFGYVPGAFTGADRRMVGKIEAADGGTLFLDEVSEMSKTLQVKLLRVLQTGEYCPVGTAESRVCDIRVLAATNRDLQQMIAAGQFRQDLFYRLNIICLELPPLRRRRGDIAMLIEYFAGRYATQYRKPALQIDPDAVKLLCAYDFPGNVRELENIICRGVILCRDGRLGVKQLPAQIVCQAHQGRVHDDGSFHRAKARAIEEFERSFLTMVLSECGGIVNRAARRAGLSERNFHAKLKQYGICSKSFRAG